MTGLQVAAGRGARLCRARPGAADRIAPELARVVRATGLAGACGRARGVKDPFQGTPATSDGGRLRALRYSGEGRSRSLLFTRDVRLLGQVHPGRQIPAAGVR